MKNFKSTFTKLMGVAVIGAAVISSCKKTTTDTPPVTPSGYSSSDEVASANLVAKFSFDGVITDAKGNISAGTGKNNTFVAGKKGQAYQGDTNAYIVYNTVGSAVKDIKNVTVAYWVKTSQHADGAKSMFQLINDSNWIGNLFVLQESGTAGSDSLRLKFTFDKWDANTAWKEQWVDYANENRLTGIVDQWAHVAFTYDGASSTATVYVNGKKVVRPDGVSKRWSNDPAQGGAPLGELQFANANRFIFGAYKQMVDGTPDGWMKNFTGNLDEFRIYNKALADADVQSLYDLESAGK